MAESYPTLMQPCHHGVYFILQLGDSYRALLKMDLFPYLGAAVALENWMGFGPVLQIFTCPVALTCKEEICFRITLTGTFPINFSKRQWYYKATVV